MPNQPTHDRSPGVRRIPRRSAVLAVLAVVAGGLAVIAAGPSPRHAAAATPPYKVLFDNTKAETAGNADWVISTSQPNPLAQNSNPTSETSWTGGISAWGVTLQRTGRYVLDTLPSGNTLTYGGSSSLDLSKFNVLVLPEPNVVLSAAEKTAVMKFVQAGGGLFMVADHTGSDRNNDGKDSLQIFNDLMSSNGVDNTDPFGITFDAENIASGFPNAIPTAAKTDPIIAGPFGTVTAGAFYNGTTETIHPSDNANVRAEIFTTGSSTTGTTNVFVSSSMFGSGRVVAIGDSSDIDDGTCASGNSCYNGWNDHSDAAIMLNGTEWLANGSTSGGGGGGGGGELITNGGFESGGAGWTESSNSGYEIVSTSKPHTGSASAWFCGSNNCTDSMYQTVAIPAGTTTTTLSWYVYVTTQETSHSYDYLRIQVRNTSGGVLSTAATYTDGSTTGSWLHGTANLAAYAGQTVQIALVSTNDSSLPTNFYVDDVSLQAS